MDENRPFKNNLIFTEEMVNAAKTRLRQKLAAQCGDEVKNETVTWDENQTSIFDNEDDEADEADEPDISDLLPFTLAEENLIDRLNAAIRKRMVLAEPETLRKTAAFLYALERLPYATPGLSLDLAVMERIGENLSYVSVELDEQSFRLSTGGSVYSPDVGGDSYSETVFEIEIGGFRGNSTEAFSEWLDAFVSAGGTIEIDGDDDTDLTEPAAEDGWDRLVGYWESHGEDAADW